jgi:hypothetical protein
MSSPDKTPRSLRAKWSDILLVCRKCSRKLGGGFGKKGRVPLDKLLKAELKGQKHGPKVLAVPCMDICPKRAVCALRGGAGRQVHLVPPGMAAQDVLAALFPDGPGPTPPRSGQPAPDQPAIGRHDQRKEQPAHRLHQPSAGKGAHDGAVAGKADQRPDGEGKL